MIERCYTNDQEVQNVQFDGHTAIVTGAATGIGRAIATRLAESGAAVALVDVDEDGVNVASEKLRSRSSKVVAIGIDAPPAHCLCPVQRCHRQKAP
jgi:NAD(P)-dependent dehydrogenase (short-subunit alcohol dehydrogenase family)